MVDVKERALFTFIGSVLLPVLLVASLLIYSTGVYKEPLRLVGLLTTAVWAIKALTYFGKYLPLVLGDMWPFKAFKAKEDYVEKYGKWAIVTGESPPSRRINLLIQWSPPLSLETQPAGAEMTRSASGSL